MTVYAAPYLLLLRMAMPLLMAAIVSCAPAFHKCSRTLPDQLMAAWQGQDPAASPLVRQVLEDSLRETYCYDVDARTNAFDLIRDLKLVEMTPLLREVAAMQYKPERGFQQTWDLISIRRALSILTKFQDPSAVELNRGRLYSDSWLQSVAMLGLCAFDKGSG